MQRSSVFGSMLSAMVLIGTVLTVSVSALRADERAATPLTGSHIQKSIAVVVVGAPASNLQARICRHIAEECDWATRQILLPPKLAQSPEYQAIMISKKLNPDDLGAVALLNIPNSDATFRSGVFSSAKVGLLDLGWLRVGPNGSRISEAVFRLRVRKESLRLVGLLLGLRDCPYPRCCMRLCDGYRELDKKGTDFCPPCQIVAERALGATGTRLRNSVAPSE